YRDGVADLDLLWPPERRSRAARLVVGCRRTWLRRRRARLDGVSMLVPVQPARSGVTEFRFRRMADVRFRQPDGLAGRPVLHRIAASRRGIPSSDRVGRRRSRIPDTDRILPAGGFAYLSPRS